MEQGSGPNCGPTDQLVIVLIILLSVRQNSQSERQAGIKTRTRFQSNQQILKGHREKILNPETGMLWKNTRLIQKHLSPSPARRSDRGQREHLDLNIQGGGR